MYIINVTTMEVYEMIQHQYIDKNGEVRFAHRVQSWQTVTSLVYIYNDDSKPWKSVDGMILNGVIYES